MYSVTQKIIYNMCVYTIIKSQAPKSLRWWNLVSISTASLYALSDTSPQHQQSNTLPWHAGNSKGDYESDDGYMDDATDDYGNGESVHVTVNMILAHVQVSVWALSVTVSLVRSIRASLMLKLTIIELTPLHSGANRLVISHWSNTLHWTSSAKKAFQSIIIVAWENSRPVD